MISELKPRSPIKQKTLRRHDLRLVTRKTFNNLEAMTRHAGQEMNRLKTDVFSRSGRNNNVKDSLKKTWKDERQC